MGRHRSTEIEDNDRRRREREDGGGALIDMRIDFELHGEVLLSVGGQWDRRMESYEADAQSGVVVRIHPGQAKAVQWFAGWLASHAVRRAAPPAMRAGQLDDILDVDPSEAYSALFAGGRRGGKTWIAAAICAAYAVAFPRSIVWAVSPTRGKDDSKADEIRRYMSSLLAPEWLARRPTANGWELANGSEIKLKSAYAGADPDAIKEGEVHLAWLNEGQKMSRRVYTVARAAIADKSGLVLVCANPPVEAKDQQWVADMASDAATGRSAAVYLDFNPLENPHIDRRALLSMAHEVDERTYAIEVLGQFRGPVDAVAYNWQRMYNELPVPDGKPSAEWPSGLIDVTEEFLRLEEEGEGIRQLIGLDVQRIPYIGGPIYKFFTAPETKVTRESVLAWIVGEEVLEGGDEEEWCHQLDNHGHDRSATLIVCDGTGEYQHSRRRAADSPPPEWAGRGSFDIIRGAGWRRIVPPSRRLHRKNPEIVDRIRAFTSMICNKFGKRRLFCDRDRAPKSAAAIREWKSIHGKPSRVQEVAHLGDGISYPLIRLFPRILRSGTPGEVDPIVRRIDRTVPEPTLREVAAERRLPRGRRGDGI